MNEETFNEMGIESKTDGCIHDGWLVISQINEVFYQDYLYWLISSNYAYTQFCGKVSGAVVKNLNSDKVANSVFFSFV